MLVEVVNALGLHEPSSHAPQLRLHGVMTQILRKFPAKKFTVHSAHTGQNDIRPVAELAGVLSRLAVVPIMDKKLINRWNASHNQ